MNRSILARIVLAATAVALVPLQQPEAYTLKSAKWSTLTVPYYVNPGNRDVTAQAAVAAIESAALGWTAQSNSPFQLVFAGLTSSTTVSNNGRNDVFFRDSSNGSAIATTYSWYSGSTMLDADIVFWDAAYKFFTGTTGCSGGFYVEDVATHEFGHALGLAHSSVSGATMYASGSYCGMSPRTLASDDILGVEALYPPSGSVNTAPVVKLTSPTQGSSYSEGASISFTASAQDAEDGALTSAIVWTSTLSGALGTGGSIQKTLPAGNHNIRATVTDSNGASHYAQVAISVVASTSSTNTAPVVTMTSPTGGSSYAEGATITFTATAQDAEDGALTSAIVWASNLSGTLGTGGSLQRTLPAGNHNIRATVTDKNGASHYAQVAISVTATTTTNTTADSAVLTARAYKVKGVQHADLRWTGIVSTSVRVMRNGVVVATTANDGAHVDALNTKGGGSAVYQVCAVDTTVCSNQATATF